MRHLIVTLDFPPLYDGGIARSMDETARALVGAGQSVRILTRGSGAEVIAHDAGYPATVTRWWGHHWLKYFPFFLEVYLPGVGRSERGAIVHTSTWELAPSVQRRAAKYGWKVYIHAQGREIARHLPSPAGLDRLRGVLQSADAVPPDQPPRRGAGRPGRRGARNGSISSLPPSTPVAWKEGSASASGAASIWEPDPCCSRWRASWLEKARTP
jgi:hypothetical protein